MSELTVQNGQLVEVVRQFSTGGYSAVDVGTKGRLTGRTSVMHLEPSSRVLTRVYEVEFTLDDEIISQMLTENDIRIL